MMMRIDEGAYRWTADHPEWTEKEGGPSGWERSVASLALVEGASLVLVDPQVTGPEAAELGELPGVVTAREVHVLVTNAWHARSAELIRARVAAWGGSVVVHVPRGVARDMPCVADVRYGEGDELPLGIRALAVPGLHPGEHVLHVPRLRAVVTGDALLGGESGLRLPPPAWGTDPARRPEMEAALARLLDLDLEAVLPGHGEAVLVAGRDALARALRATTYVTGGAR